MKKIFFIFILIFLNMDFVLAKEDILSKYNEVSQSYVDNGWSGPDRRLIMLEDKYVTFDKYMVTPFELEWFGYDRIVVTSYDENWQEINKVDYLNHNVNDRINFLFDDNNLFSYSYKISDNGYDYQISKYDGDLNSVSINFNYKNVIENEDSSEEFCNFLVQDFYIINDEVYFLVHILNPSLELLDKKILKIGDNFKEYLFLDVTDNEIQNMFPIYYYKNMVYNNENNYYIKNNKLLVSGESLSFYDNEIKKFEVTNDDYVRFGNAKLYNNLIIVIGYINYIKAEYPGFYTSTEMYGLNNSDILFYDLEGNLIGTYEHNNFDYDIMLVEDKLVVSNLYIDGICKVIGAGYFTYNTECRATLMNEIYNMSELYLNMANGNDDIQDEIKNPETLPNVDYIIKFSFIAIIILIIVRLVKYRSKTS